MRLQRQINRLNRKLEQQLGTDPAFSWQHTSTLMHPMIRCGDDGRDEMEITWNPTSLLFESRPAIEIVPLLRGERYRDRWVVCWKHIPTEQEWMSAFNTTVHYPRSGRWVPCSDLGGYIILKRGLPPDESSTDQVIKAFRELRAHLAEKRDTEYEYLRADAKRRKARRDHLTEAIREEGAVVSSQPGKKREVSLATTRRGLWLPNTLKESKHADA